MCCRSLWREDITSPGLSVQSAPPGTAHSALQGAAVASETEARYGSGVLCRHEQSLPFALCSSTKHAKHVLHKQTRVAQRYNMSRPPTRVAFEQAALLAAQRARQDQHWCALSRGHHCLKLPLLQVLRWC